MLPFSPGIRPNKPINGVCASALFSRFSSVQQMSTHNAVLVIDLLSDASRIDPLFRPCRVADTIQAILEFCSHDVVAAALEELLPRIHKVVVLNLPPALQQQRLVLQQLLQVISRTRITPSERRSAQAAITNLAELSATCPLFGVAGTFSGDAVLVEVQNGKDALLMDEDISGKPERTQPSFESTPAAQLHWWLEKEMGRRNGYEVDKSEEAFEGTCRAARLLYKNLSAEAVAQQLPFPLLHASANGDAYFLKRFITPPDMPSAYLPHSQKTLEGAIEQRRVWEFLYRCSRLAFMEGKIVYLIDDF